VASAQHCNEVERSAQERVLAAHRRAEAAESDQARLRRALADAEAELQRLTAAVQARDGEATAAAAAVRRADAERERAEAERDRAARGEEALVARQRAFEEDAAGARNRARFCF
jgi:hypothetical protein